MATPPVKPPVPPVPPAKSKFPFPSKGVKAPVAPGKPKLGTKVPAVNLKDSMARRLQK